MVNITKEGPKPNFVTYKEPFYRDAAYVAMLCEETGNLEQIIPWIESISEIYDLQRGENIKEPDNLGELLYMQSLLPTPNWDFVDEIIEEAYRIRNNEGMLSGTMDGEEHPNYVTGWLKFGLESLGLDSSDWKLDSSIKDSYTDLLWFFEDPALNEWRKSHSYYFNSLWPYIDYARGNFYNVDLDVYYKKNNESYMSYEPANSSAWGLIDKGLSEVKSSTPHIWSAVEMYFYYLNKESYN